MNNTSQSRPRPLTLLWFGVVVACFGACEPALAASSPQYKVVESPGRGGDLRRYERLLNEMWNQGWEFDHWLYHGSAQDPDLIFRRRKDASPDPEAANRASALERIVVFRTGQPILLGIAEGAVTIDSVTITAWPKPEILGKAGPDDTTKISVRFTYTNRDIRDWKCDYSVAFLDEKGAELATGERQADLDKRKEGDTSNFSVKMRTLDFPKIAKLTVRALPQPK